MAVPPRRVTTLWSKPSLGLMRGPIPCKPGSRGVTYSASNIQQRSRWRCAQIQTETLRAGSMHLTRVSLSGDSWIDDDGMGIGALSSATARVHPALTGRRFKQGKPDGDIILRPQRP